ncbi:phosphate signaling complex protein PhoU [Paenibacillus elgii]|uniref:Phosphate-specific transport system accessory protein PhoU n=1 Tax=Paenibacillus elgii TaxID=189691 RepID=A0A161S484_9BACL|nr:phosphate signaling complex protein PhoU [Paenibacillus elgii]KZE79384.1 PhoU family transcriptional regulator [Paenibacillus elgii]MCM3270204.1 phosphate signaling complex protein PhoU [Paenibacillus elgii]NEN83091.1 phosphate signaling complex protein PhoU [Paenibacillus elgii]PUA37076.1 phosphate transport system regulatory protein PhoU [Paenibacillus elgii]
MDNRFNFHQSLDLLQKDLLDMGNNVARLIRQAVESLARLDEGLARQTIEEDDQIDEMTARIEEDSLRLIALQQPMASDLRIISMALKIATDLERIADHAVDIAKICIRLNGQELVKPLEDIPRMAELTQNMLQESLLAYTERDVHRAAALAEKDDEVDKLYSVIVNDIIMLMGTDFAKNRQLSQLMLAAHFLERVADHSTNIGEGVIFMVTGKRKDLNV